MSEEAQYQKVKAGKTGFGLQRIKEKKIAKHLQDYNVLLSTADLTNAMAKTDYIIGDESCFLDNSTMHLSHISFPQIDKKGRVRPKTIKTEDITFEQFMFNEGLGEEFLRTAVLGTTATFLTDTNKDSKAEGGSHGAKVNDSLIKEGGGDEPAVTTEETEEEKEARLKKEAKEKREAEWAKKRADIAAKKGTGKGSLPMKGKIREQAVLRFLEEMYPNCVDLRTQFPMEKQVKYDPKTEVYVACHQVEKGSNKRVLIMSGSVKSVLSHCKQVSASPLMIQEAEKKEEEISEVDANGKKKSKKKLKKERKARAKAEAKAKKEAEKKAKEDSKALEKAAKGHGLCGSGAVKFSDDGETAAADMTSDTGDSFLEEAERLEGEGCKMMGMAYCEVDAKKVEKLDFKDAEKVLKKAGKELKWVGMTGLYTEVFKGMDTLAADAKKHNTRFLFMSDAPPNYISNVAKRVGVLTNPKTHKVISGKDLDDVNASTLDGNQESRAIGFSVPSDKRNKFYINVIQIIQKMNKTVAAFSNSDMGALKAADLAVVKASAKPEVRKVGTVVLTNDSIGSYVKGMDYVNSVIGKNALFMCMC